MKRWLLAVAMGAVTLLGAGAASAEVDTGARASDRVFDDAELDKETSKALEAELKAVEKRCHFQMFSREGPKPSEVAACEAVVARIVKRGPSVSGAVLARLDGAGRFWDVKRRLYDVLARTKDARLIEPLVRGMARIATRRINNRDWEIDTIHETLGALTHAEVGERAPWTPAPRLSSHRRSISLVVDWRLWLEKNRGLSHAELTARRLEEARAHAEDANAERAYGAVVYLLEQDGLEGIRAAKKLAEREDVPESGRNALAYRIQVAEEAARMGEPKKARAPRAYKASKKAVPGKMAPPSPVQKTPPQASPALVLKS